MDLPLARCESSPPNCIRRGAHSQPHPPHRGGLRRFPVAPPHLTRSPFDFTPKHEHRQNFYSVCSDKPSRNVLSRKRMSFYEKSVRSSEVTPFLFFRLLVNSISCGSSPRPRQYSR